MADHAYRLRGLIWVAMVALLAGCGLIQQASPTAVSTPSGYTTTVGAARTLAIQDLRAVGASDWSRMYADRKASACFRDRWPALRTYEHWWTANWGSLSSGPGEVPSPSAPLKLLSARGDDQHQVVVLEAMDPSFVYPPLELYVLRRFATGWAILNWLPYNASHVSNGNPPYRVSTKVWDPCHGAIPYTPDDAP